MNRMYRGVIVIVALLLVVSLATTARASCYGTACFDLDPYSQGCVSGSQEKGRDQTGNLITLLKYSSSCGSMWTTVGSNDFSNHHFYGETYSTFLETSEEMYNTSGIWTNMVSGVSGQKCAWGAMGPANDDLNVFASTSPCWSP